MIRTPVVLAAFAVAACGTSPAPASVPAPVAPAAPVSSDSLLAASRIAALPEPGRSTWQRYVQRSRENAARDRAAMDAELRAAGKETWTPAPAGRGFAVADSMTDAWFRGPAARRLADVLVSYQTPTGGWSKRIEFTRPRQPGESFSAEQRWTWIGTLDNGSTTEQLVFLARAFAAHGDARHAESFNRGVAYLLEAQQPTGCWPQVYPLMGGYHDAATYNDDATVHALEVLRRAGGLEWVPAELSARAAAAVRRGIGCIVATQVQVEGRKTVWGAQHDPIGLAPVKARAYELASLSGRESAAILNFLMQEPDPSPAVVQAIHAGAAWFRETAITGYAYVPRGELTAQAGAGPLWARFYEIGTNRPIFSDRDGQVRYDLSEVGEERRTGYLWYTDEPATTLRRYERWVQRRG